MPSADTTRPTSATVSCMADSIRTAPARPPVGPSAERAILAADAGNSAEHQPPLRPEAPKPATSRSSTIVRRLGSARAR
jgi:hypothetical protein